MFILLLFTEGSKSGLYRAIGFIGTIYLVDRDLWVDSRRSPGSNMNFLRLINDAKSLRVDEAWRN
ncbi:hypothetical protein T10_8514 [Trichinella papuae]|uniref:Uncharacterized protein n=1 Tax=Trichinella papuae TaxID=268474 RepID=A0A0V1M447_9BILA|nr:hypothetical protein T10_8514 [Trichinella papuae]